MNIILKKIKEDKSFKKTVFEGEEPKNAYRKTVPFKDFYNVYGKETTELKEIKASELHKLSKENIVVEYFPAINILQWSLNKNDVTEYFEEFSSLESFDECFELISKIQRLEIRE